MNWSVGACPACLGSRVIFAGAGAGNSPEGLQHPQSVSTTHPWDIRRQRAASMLCNLFLAAAFYGALPHPAKPSQSGWDGSITVTQRYFPLNPSLALTRAGKSPPRSIPPARMKDLQESNRIKKPQADALAQLIPATCPKEYI